MFKKLDDLSKPTLMNKSSMRELKGTLEGQSEIWKEWFDQIIGKKTQLNILKLKNEFKKELIVNEKNEIMFVTDEEIVIPSLKLVHMMPSILPRTQIDKGGIKFILSGADIMCPGLTSEGGFISEEQQKGDVVAVFAEGKQHAIAVGIMEKSGADIKKTNKGVGIKNVLFLNDTVWNFKK